MSSLVERLRVRPESDDDLPPRAGPGKGEDRQNGAPTERIKREEKEILEAAKIHPWLKIRLNNFHKKMDSMEKSDDEFIAISPDWTTVDRILSSRKNSTGEREYYVKWKELTYEECTWENESDISAFQPQIECFNEIQSRRKKSAERGKGVREPRHFKETPKFLSGGTLHPYQLEGLNFLHYSWHHNKRVILGDEMGLGKMIQSIAFLASLFEDKFSPHLVVVPLSTLRNWEHEFSTWAPQMNVVMYFGAAASREIIRKYEFYYPTEKSKKLKKMKPSPSNDEKQSRIKFDVLLTSYEMINMDSAVLKNIEWESLVVDEGHRLKNKDLKLFGQLKEYNTKHRVLLTGTPVQNNLDDLFMLMNFLEGESYEGVVELQEEFKDINQDKLIEKLHRMLKPHLLRSMNLENKPNKAELRKLVHREPEFCPQLEIMFKNVAVDGSTSYIPAEEEDEYQEDEVEENFASPMSSGSKKRASTSTTASSHRKKPKKDIINMMSRMTKKQESKEERNHAILKAQQMDKGKKRNKLGADVKSCMDLAVECGAVPGSVELFGCTLFFKEEYYREVFKSIPTIEGRLDWVKRMCAHEKLY